METSSIVEQKTWLADAGRGSILEEREKLEQRLQEVAMQDARRAIRTSLYHIDLELMSRLDPAY